MRSTLTVRPLLFRPVSQAKGALADLLAEIGDGASTGESRLVMLSFVCAPSAEHRPPTDACTAAPSSPGSALVGEASAEAEKLIGDALARAGFTLLAWEPLGVVAERLGRCARRRDLLLETHPVTPWH